MSYEMPGVSTPEEMTCKYGASKLHFRGPKRALDMPYMACVGGTETFGRFVAEPFPALLEKRMGETCVNLGCVNGGLDTMMLDPDLLSVARSAEICLLQVTGAQNLSNRMYRVHPRRNDRFLEASPRLAALYEEVDFTEFHFNKHLLSRLLKLSPERFSVVQHELQQAWTARMRSLIELLGQRLVLFRLQYQAPVETDSAANLGAEPLMIEADMIASLADQVLGCIEIPVRVAGESEELGDMIFGTLQEPAAEHMIGPETHQIIADQIYRALQDIEI